MGMIRDTIKNRNILVLMVTQTLFMFTASLWWPYRSLYILELGATKVDLGLLLTLETIASIIFQLPGGILTDRWGRRRMLIISSAIRVGSPLVFLFSSYWVHLAPGIVLASAGMLGMPAQNALIAESLLPESRGSGFAAIGTVTSIPTIITSLMGGMVMDYFGVVPGCRLILIASFLTGIFSLVMRWRYITETFVPDRTPRPRVKGKSMLQELLSLSRDLWIVTVVGAISMFAMRIMMSYMVIYGVEVVGLSKTQWGLIGTLVSVMTTLLTTPAGMLADRVGKKPVILASRTINAFSVLGYTFSHNFVEMFAVRSLGGIGNGLGGAMWGPMGGPVWQALVADLSPPEERGTIMGLMGTIGSIVSSPASWAGGYIYENISPGLPFRASFALDIMGTLIFFLFLKLPEKKSRHVEIKAGS